MAGIAQRVARGAWRASGLKALSLRLRHRRLQLGPRVNLELAGEMRYGEGCAVGEGSNLIVPDGAVLSLADRVSIGRYVELGPGGQIAIGTDSSIQDRSILVGDVAIGRHCLVSLNVLMSSGRHYFELHPTWLIRDQDRLAATDAALRARHSRPIRVEDDCWIGMNAAIMPGVTLGRGAVVGAGAIVTQDVAPYSVVAGSPAREIRKRFEFSPPKRIVHSEPGDWPYFYSGFELEQSMLRHQDSRDGLLARDEFVLCLDARDASTLRLRVRALDSAEIRLRFGEQVERIGREFQDVAFRLDSHAAAQGLRLRAEPHASRIQLSGAWVE